MTCAVPVLPATLRPSMRPRPPVPAAFTTIQSPSCSADSVSGRNATRLATAGGGTAFQPVPQVGGAVPTLQMALVEVPVDGATAGTVHREVRGDEPLLERSRRHDDLERGPGGIAPLNHAVLQRPQLVRVERRPRRPVDPG